MDIGKTRTSYHISIDVEDRPGVLANVATVFADCGVSICTLRQVGRGSDAQLLIESHEALDADLSQTVEKLKELGVVRDVSSVMRVEGGAR